MQVVAGKNYKLVIDLATKEQKVQAYEATVYGDFQFSRIRFDIYWSLHKLYKLTKSTDFPSEREL